MDMSDSVRVLSANPRCHGDDILGIVVLDFANNDVNMDRKSGAIMVPPFSLITFIDALTSFPQDSATGSLPGD